MKNLGERIDVGFGAREDDGTKLEPEQQPVRRTIFTDADAKHGEDAVGNLRASITADMTAVEAAALLAQPCHLCGHWRPDEWPRIRAKMEATPEGLADLNRLRAAYLANGGAGLEDGNDGYDVEHALAHGRIGVCKALTDLLRNDTLTDRDACCPDVDGAGNPLPPLFVARHGGEARAVDKTRDEILKLASKKGR